MNKINIIFIIFISLVSTVTHGMFCSLVKTKTFQSVTTKNAIQQRSYNSRIAPELRQLIFMPNFTRRQASKIIKTKMSKQPKSSDDAHELIKDVIDKAIQYQSYEKKYAYVLNKLYDHGWSIKPCCNGWRKELCCYPAELAHKAAQNDLLFIMKALLKQNKEFTIARQDLSGRISLHYAQSEAMAHLLIKNGADINAKDSLYETPLHTVPYAATALLLCLEANPQAGCFRYLGSHRMTPLDTAARNGDIKKVKLLLKTNKFSEDDEARALETLDYAVNLKNE